MKKEKNIIKIPVVAISTFGHCGIDWLHSLIDSHKQVLILPPLSFFRKIEILKKKKIYLNETLDKKKILNIVKNINLLDDAQSSALKRNYILKKKQNKLKFIKYLSNFLIKQKDLNIEKMLFFAIHYAYAKINKINLNKIKIIVAHEHAPWNCYQYSKYFNSKFVLMVRDPRATIAGSLRGFKRYKNIPINFPFDINLSFAISAHNFCKKMTKKKILILRNEDMVKSLESEMKKLSRWLNIKFDKSLLSSTFGGKKWLGESSYLGKSDLKKSRPKDYYKPINIEARWRNFLDKKTIFIIETVYEEIMLQNKYKLDNKLPLISKFLGYFVALFKFQEFNNYLSLIKYSFIKSVIRRFFILFFSEQSRKIFDIV